MRENEDSYKRFQLDVENIAKLKEKEMAELKDAYKEKHRKCQAWEKVMKYLNRQQFQCLKFHPYTPMESHVILQAYNNIRDQIITPNGFDTDSRDSKVATYKKNHVAPFEHSTGDHSKISRDRHHEVSKSDQYTNARAQALSNGREDSLIYPTAIPTQLASFQLRPVRALRRTEVTTYRYHNMLIINSLSLLQILHPTH